MSRTDVKTPNPCVLTLEEQIQLLAFLKKFNIKLGTVFLPTAAPPPFGASGIGPNLQIKATKLDTIQDIQTASKPQFDSIGIGTPATISSAIYFNGFFFHVTAYGQMLLGTDPTRLARCTFDINYGSTGNRNYYIYPAVLACVGPSNINSLTNVNGATPIITVESTDTYAKDSGGAIVLGGRYQNSENSALFVGLLGAKENNTANDYAGYFAIYTNVSAYGVAERLRVTSLGNIGINTAAPTKRFSITEKLQIDDNGLPVKSNNIGLVGQGFPLIVAAGNLTGQTGAITSLTSFTTSSAGGSFEIGGYIDVTAFTAGTISLLCDYTDPSGTVRTLTIPLIALAGTISPTIGAATDASAVISAIQTSGANAIKIYTSVSLFTGTYNAYAWIKQIV